MRIELLSQDQDGVHALSAHALRVRSKLADLGTSDGLPEPQPQWVPGATEGWWELAVDIGVVSAPISIVCNIVASWIWDAFKHAPDRHSAVSSKLPATEVRLILTQGDKVAEVSFSTDDKRLIEDALKAALIHANFVRGID